MRLNNTGKRIVGLVVVAFCLIVISGGFYNKIHKPGPYVQRSGRIYTIDPGPRDQASTEAHRAFLCNLTTTVGVFLIGYSQKKLDDPTLAYRIVLVGIALICFGLMGAYYLGEMKRTASPVY